MDTIDSPPLLGDAARTGAWLRPGAGGARLPLFGRRRAPAPPTLDGLRDDVMRCRACPLHAAATQAVFGEGPRPARLMLVGEQPGDQEDMAGRPIAGAAGQLLDRALAEAGIARDQIYVTNAVKHFKFAPRGRRRVQQKAERQEIAACRSWLDHEIALVKPSLIVALGAAAGRALLGRGVAVGVTRGQFYSLPSCVRVAVTVHPSDILRGPERQPGAADYDRFVADLRAAQASIDDMEPAADPMPLSKAS
jgi:uracil-DNA glycosylase family protein